MKPLIIAAVTVAALFMGGEALAQAAPAAPAAQAGAPAPDPVRLQLARQVIEASGGVTSLQARFKAMFATVKGVMSGAVPASSATLVSEIFDDMEDEEVKAVPEMVDQMTRIYAEHLTEGELRDLLAWTDSPSGRSIQQKMPAITQDLLVEQQPLFRRLMAGAMKRSIDHVCAESNCTPEQRQQIAGVVAKILPASS
jgi:hypothetical protein